MIETFMTYQEFLDQTGLSQTTLWRHFYLLHRDKIEIKKQKVAEQKLAILINATFKLSHDRGFALMTLRDLSRETKMSLGSIYSYIGSKEQLALMIHQFLPYLCKLYLQDQPMLCNDKTSIRNELMGLIRGHIYLTEYLRPWFFFAYMEAKYTSKAIKTIALTNEKETQNLVLKLIKKGQKTLKIDDPMLATMTIKALLQNWYLKRPVFQKQKITPERYVRHIESLLEKGL